MARQVSFGQSNLFFPQIEIQQYIILQVQNTTKFVFYKERKPLTDDLKRVYKTPIEEIALAGLDSFDEKWSGKYMKIGKILERQLGESFHLFQVFGSRLSLGLYD